MKLWLAAAGIMALSGAAMAQPWMSGNGFGTGGMMGGGFGGMMAGGMGGMMEDRPVAPGWGGPVFDYAKAAAFIQYGAQQGEADAKANTVTFSGPQVVINLVAVRPGFPDQTFELHGLTNPTVIVPRGATVQINLLNMDYGRDMEHAVEISAVPPPYPEMAMMAAQAPLVVPEVPWRSEDDVKQAHYAALGRSFVAEVPGHYWYLCPTPGHAREGMYGRFIVR